MEIMSIKHKRKPKAPKPKAKPRAKAPTKAKTPTRKQAAQIEGEMNAHLTSLSLEQRKMAVYDALETFMKTTPPAEREEFAEHIHGVGLELLGLVNGIDVENAMVVFPDDP